MSKFTRGDVVQIMEGWTWAGDPNARIGRCYMIVAGPRNRNYADEYEAETPGQFVQYVGILYDDGDIIGEDDVIGHNYDVDEFLFGAVDRIDSSLPIRYIDEAYASLVPLDERGKPDTKSAINAYYDRAAKRCWHCRDALVCPHPEVSA